ncbi:MAG: chemotaxis protein CheW [bacterium]|nr:chemotaxis protein CheW [bacterium]
MSSNINIFEDSENDVIEKEKDTIQMVSFLLANGLYGIDISDIREIINPGKITYVPGSADYIKGVMNVRGMVIPVVDLGKLLGLPEIAFSDNTRIIIIETTNATSATGTTCKIGCLIDEVMDIVHVLPNKINPPPSTLEKNKAKYIKGEVQIGDKLMAILELKNM